MNKTLPSTIRNIIKNKKFNIDNIGKTSSDVFIFDDMVLKIQENDIESKNEVTILKNLVKEIPIPNIIKLVEKDGILYNLISKINGNMLCDESLLRNPDLLLELLCDAFRMLWSIDINKYKFDNASNINQRLKIARYNVENNLVDVNNVMPETFGKNGFENPEELLKWLENNIPEEDLVFTHGDFCFENIFYKDSRISGFIDLGKAGIADRWQDLAICIRELDSVFSNEYIKDFDYKKYNSDMLLSKLYIEKDNKKLKYYMLLDELF